MPKPNVRDKLIAAGLEVLHRLGFNGCSVQDIAQAANVPKGSFYNHFESKEVFAVEILDMYWQRMANADLRILSQTSLSPVQRLKHYFESLAQGLADLEFERGCLLGNFSTELSDQSKLLRDRLSVLFAGWTRALESCIREAQAAGEVRTDLDAAMLAAFLINAWEGAVLRAKVDREARSLTQFNAVVFTHLLT